MHNALVLTVPKYKFENATILRYDTHYDSINPYNHYPLSDMKLYVNKNQDTSRYRSSTLANGMIFSTRITPLCIDCIFCYVRNVFVSVGENSNV